MRIRTIRLHQGYKRFFDLTIDLGENPKKIIALVGPNGCGKSSVFDGMAFLNNRWELIGSAGAKDNQFHSMTGATITHNSIQINFDTAETFEQVKARKREVGKANTILSLRNSYRYNSSLNVRTLEALPDIRMNNFGASSSVDLDDKMTQNYMRLYVYINTFRRQKNLTDIQANEQVIGELNTILQNCLGLTLSHHGDIMDGKGSLFFTKANQPNEFNFNVLSSGEKEVVDILLDIYLKRQEYDETIYLIDEPELHLNTAIQKKLLIEIERLIPDTCQLWVATHSIGFLNALQNDLRDASDIIAFDGDYSNIQTTLTPMIKNRENWQKIFKTALEDLTGLIAPRIIIYCEGRPDPGANGEELGLDAEVYNTIFSKEFPETLFVSSGGNTEPDKYSGIAMKVLNKAFKEVSILLLKDKDIHPDGSPTTDADREQFINKNPALNRMLKRREIENYLFDIEILRKVRHEITNEEYAALIVDIQGGNVKDIAGQVMALCGINNGINQQDFKKQLANLVTEETSVYQELKLLLFPLAEAAPVV